MAHRAITLTTAPHALSEALQFTLSLHPADAGQQIAQREILSALENAMDARRQRLTISQSQVTGFGLSGVALTAAGKKNGPVEAEAVRVRAVQWTGANERSPVLHACSTHQPVRGFLRRDCLRFNCFSLSESSPLPLWAEQVRSCSRN